MKVKDLFDFNPEAEICFLGLDYLPIELDIYGWSTGVAQIQILNQLQVNYF